MNFDKIKNFINFLGIKDFVRTSNWVNMCCPLSKWTHANGRDQKPSFGIYINETGKSTYNCFTCGHSGTLLNLVTTLKKYNHNLDIISLLAFIQENDSSIINNQDFDSPKFFITQPIQPINPAIYSDLFSDVLTNKNACNYLVSRNIDLNCIKKLNLQYDEQSKRIVFPIYDQHKNLYGYSGRSIVNTEPKVKDYFGLPKKHLLLGMENFKCGLPIILVEGLFGYASLISKGVDKIANVLACLGATLTNEKANLLISLNHSIYLLFDNDLGGQIGLFGKQDSKGNFMGGGAVDKLYNQVPIFVPDYSIFANDCDDLEFSHIEKIFEKTLPLTLTKKTYYDNMY